MKIINKIKDIYHSIQDTRVDMPDGPVKRDKIDN